MASSLKVSELNSLNQLTDNDLFLVSDIETNTSRKVTYSTLKNNVTNQLAGIVAQNRQDAETLVETIRAALQLAIDDNTSYSTETRSSLTTTSEELQQGIDNLGAYLNSDMWLFSNQSEFPSASENHGRVVHSHADGAMFYAHAGQWIELSTKLFVDGLDTRITSVESTTSQNSTDIAALQTTVDNLDIDIAPETLNSINELSAAIGDDPTFLTTLQDRVSVIENDNATQTELDSAVSTLNTTISTGDTSLQSQLDDYIAHIEARNLEAALAFGELYVDTLYGG